MPMTNEVLNATGMSLTVFVGGSSNIGLGITGTWVGTLTFYGSTDGINFFPITMTPFASGTAVGSATANGNYFTPTQNYLAIRVTFTRTSGSATITIASAVDASWQNAFLSASTICVSSTTSGGNNTLTQAAQANRAWNLTFLEISLAGVIIGAALQVDIFDGGVAGTKLYSAFLTQTGTGSVGTVQKINLPADGITNTPGNAMTIVVRGTPSALQSNTINAKFSAA